LLSRTLVGPPQPRSAAVLRSTCPCFALGEVAAETLQLATTARSPWSPGPPLSPPRAGRDRATSTRHAAGVLSVELVQALDAHGRVSRRGPALPIGCRPGRAPGLDREAAAWLTVAVLSRRGLHGGGRIARSRPRRGTGAARPPAPRRPGRSPPVTMRCRWPTPWCGTVEDPLLAHRPDGALRLLSEAVDLAGSTHPRSRRRHPHRRRAGCPALPSTSPPAASCSGPRG
jgi:hypothetical protein